MQNPLRKFKEKNLDMEWKDISEKTGLSIQTLISVADKDEKKIGGVTLATAEPLRRILDINLGEYYKQ